MESLAEQITALERAWRDFPASGSPPDWTRFLPSELPSTVDVDLLLTLLRTDIEHRVKHGLPALLVESYLDHPVLRTLPGDQRDRRQFELIGWEYRLRWRRGQRVLRAEYARCYPHLRESVEKLRILWNCSKCRRTQIPLEDESARLAVCPGCGTFVRVGGIAAGPRTAVSYDRRDYRLQEVIGRGGMCEVYRCVDPALGRELALKVLHRDLTGYAEAERRLEREARIIGRLEHPGIVPVHNLGRLADGRLFFTMKRVVGQTLKCLLDEAADPAAERSGWVVIFAKVCQAMAFAHAQGILHRDLKPANVMAGTFGAVYVMDWGLAKCLPDAEPDAHDPLRDGVDPSSLQTLPGQRLGTLLYMPPEQARGEVERIDRRSDVFALGAILCEILTGRSPYLRDDETTDTPGLGSLLLERTGRGDVTAGLMRLTRCSATWQTLADLCRTCLAVEPGERPHDASDLVAAVDRR